MKPMLTAMLTIVSVLAIAVAGTWATFSDTEVSTGNTFTAGTFDINIIGSLPFEEWGISPGWSNTEMHSVKNIGSLAGEVYITAENFEEPSGYFAEPSKVHEVTPEQFARVLRMEVKADLNNDHTYETTIYDGPLYGMETDRMSVGPGQSIQLLFRAYLPMNLDDPTTPVDDDDNLYQGNGVNADIVFYGTTETTLV